MELDRQDKAAEIRHTADRLLAFLDAHVLECQRGSYYHEWSLEDNCQALDANRPYRSPDKLLYGNARLGWALMLLYKTTEDEAYKEKAKEIIDFVLRELYAQDRLNRGHNICYYEYSSNMRLDREVFMK